MARPIPVATAVLALLFFLAAALFLVIRPLSTRLLLARTPTVLRLAGGSGGSRS